MLFSSSLPTRSAAPARRGAAAPPNSLKMRSYHGAAVMDEGGLQPGRAAPWAWERSVWRVAAMARLFKMKRDTSTTFVVLALLCWQCARARWSGLGSRGADGPSNAGYARV